MKSIPTFFKLFLVLSFIIIIQTYSVISVKAQTCDQLEIIYTEPDCFKAHEGTSGQPSDQRGCKEISACVQTNNKYNSSLFGAGYVSYLWAATGPAAVTFLPNNTSPQVNIVWPVVGTYTLILTVTDINGNVFTNCLTVNVREKPVAAFTFAPNNQCAGSTTNFTNTSTYAGGGMIYSWNFGDPSSGVNNISNATNPSHIFNASGTYTVTLIASSFTTVTIGGAQGKPETLTQTCCSDTTTQVVTVVPGTLKIECISTVCAGQIQTYNSVGCANTTWAAPIGGTMLSFSPTSITIQWGSGAVQGQIIASCPSGCSTSVPVPIIPLNPQPVGNLIPCLNATTSYTLPVLPGTFYTWTLTNITTPAVYTTSPEIFTYPDNITVWVNWGQIAILPGDVFQLSVNLNNEHICCNSTGFITITPKGTFGAFSDATICLNGTANLIANPSVGTFNWATLPAAGVSPATLSNSPSYSPTFSIAGTYTATVTETAGTYCNSVTPQSVKVTVLPATPAPGTIVGPTTVCPGSTLAYSMSTSAPAGYHYSWSIIPADGSFQPGGGANVTGDNVNINWVNVPGGTVSVYLERNTFPSCPSPTVTLTVTSATVGMISGPTNVCVDTTIPPVIYTLTGGTIPAGTTVNWTITPTGANPTTGTITAGQGTTNITVLWHGGANSGPWTALVNATTTCGNPTSFLVTVYPKFTFTLQKNNVDICQVGGTTLSIVPTAPANISTYSWSNGGVGATTSVTAPGIYSLEITNIGGCKFSNTIEVLDPLKITTGCTVGVCTGPGTFKEDLSVSATAPFPGLISYQWVHVGFGNVGINSPNYSATIAGTYTVTVTYGTGVGVCTKTLTFNVAQVCCPDTNTPNFTFVQNSCTEYTFTGTTPNPIPAQWHWDFGDGSTLDGTLTPPKHQYAAAGIYCVKFCVGDINGCGVNCTIQNVVVPIQAQFISQLRCNGCLDITNISTDLSSQIPGSTVTSSWNFGDGSPVFVGTNPGQHCFPATGGTFNVVLTMTFNNNVTGPGNVTCQSIYSQAVTYTPLSMSIVPPIVCTDIPATFTSVPSNFITYNWDFDDGYFAFSPTSIHTYATGAVYNVVLTVTDILGTTCTATQTITVQAGFNCTILPAYICPGGQGVLTGPNILGATYAWQEFVLGNWISATGTNNAMVYNATTPGLYRVITTDPSTGCICTSNAVQVLAVPKPTAKIMVSPTKKLCAPGGFVTLTSVNHLAGYTSNWFLNNLGTPIPGNFPILFNQAVNTTTTFILVLTNEYGCTDQCQIVVEVNPLPAPPIISTLPGGPVCEGSATTFTITNYANNNSWSTGETTNSITVFNSGAYVATHTVAATGCSSSTTVVVHPRPSTALFPHFCDDILCECHNAMNPFAIYAPRPLIGPFATNYNVSWFNSPSGTPISGPPITNGGLDFTNLPSGVQTGIYYITMVDPNTGCASTSPTYDVTVPTFEDCANCSCDMSSFGTITYSTITPSATYVLTCGQLPETISCAVPYQLFANYNCFPMGCDSYVTATITDPSSMTNTYTLPYTFIAPTTGTYSIVFTGYCNGVACNKCTISFNACPALAVNLVSFTGVKQEKTIELNWLTSTEKFNSYYDLERSDDGLKFINLAKIPTKNANSNEKISYNYTDLFPTKGMNYYRLKAIDLEGKASNSKVIAVDFDDYGLTKIYPNPSKIDFVSIEIPNNQTGKIKLEWYDMLGRVIKTNNLTGIKGQNKFEINVSDLPVGKYLIKINKENEIGIGSILNFER